MVTINIPGSVGTALVLIAGLFVWSVFRYAYFWGYPALMFALILVLAIAFEVTTAEKDRAHSEKIEKIKAKYHKQ